MNESNDAAKTNCSLSHTASVDSTLIKILHLES